MIVRSVALGLLATLALACSSNDEGSGSEGSGGAGGSGTGGAAGSGGDSVLSLAPPENGFQLSIRGRMIESGQDAEFCEVVQIPGTPDDVYYVNELEVEMAAFSHHLNVYSVVVGSPVDETAEVGDQHECLQPSLGYDNAGTFGDAFRYVIGSQTPTNWAKYPEGIGFRYVGGQKVIFNFHYLNTSKESVPARARVNFHTVDASLVSKPPQVFAMLNQTLNIPPRSKDSYTMQCTVRQDIGRVRAAPPYTPLGHGLQSLVRRRRARRRRAPVQLELGDRDRLPVRPTDARPGGRRVSLPVRLRQHRGPRAALRRQGERRDVHPLWVVDRRRRRPRSGTELRRRAWLRNH